MKKFQIRLNEKFEVTKSRLPLQEAKMLRKIAGVLMVAAMFAASAASAHQVHYAMAAADAKPAMQPLPGKVYTALAADAGAAKAEALAQCRDAGNGSCNVIGSGPLSHGH